jgi:hypothetical protein
MWIGRNAVVAVVGGRSMQLIERVPWEKKEPTTIPISVKSKWGG